MICHLFGHIFPFLSYSLDISYPLFLSLFLKPSDRFRLCTIPRTAVALIGHRPLKVSLLPPPWHRCRARATSVYQGRSTRLSNGSSSDGSWRTKCVRFVCKYSPTINLVTESPIFRWYCVHIGSHLFCFFCDGIKNVTKLSLVFIYCAANGIVVSDIG